MISIIFICLYVYQESVICRVSRVSYSFILSVFKKVTRDIRTCVPKDLGHSGTSREVEKPERTKNPSKDLQTLTHPVSITVSTSHLLS